MPWRVEEPPDRTDPRLLLALIEQVTGSSTIPHAASVATGSDPCVRRTQGAVVPWALGSTVWLAAGRGRLLTGTAPGLTGGRWVRPPLFQRT
jgi:hypothetical protein